MNRNIFFGLLFLATAATIPSVFASSSSEWASLCSNGSVSKLSAKAPIVNYSNEKIQNAAKKLNMIHPDSFWLYSDIEGVYGLCTRNKEDLDKCLQHAPRIVAGTKMTVTTHNFLTILCGEFRDNMPMLEAKLNWVSNITLVQKGEQTYDADKGVWEQLTGQGYYDLLAFSKTLYYARLRSLENTSKYLELEQNSVPAASLCEYRYMLKNYISNGIRNFNIYPYEDYEQGLKEFLAGNECSNVEKNVYNEFRGDGNFKPQSLESNAFIWNSRIFAKNCSSTTKAKPSSILTDENCTNYFKAPFSSRKNLAAQGLMRLMFYPEQYNSLMEDYRGTLVFITEDLTGDDIAEMIILDKSKANSLGDTEESGAYLVEKLRGQIKQLRKDKQYGIAKNYGKFLHYIALKQAIFTQEKTISSSQLKKLSSVLKRAEEDLVENKTNYERTLAKLTNTNILEEVEEIKKRISELEEQVSKLLADGKSVEADGLQIEIKKLEEKIEKLTRSNNPSKIEKIKRDIDLIRGIIEAEKFDGVEVVTEVHSNWKKSYLKEKDKGFAKTFPNKNDAWSRIATVLDRHTDWYEIDMLNLELGVYQPTFSPWLASSYYINKSDAFTKPGYAMGLPGDGHRHWMYVQRVPKTNWFNATHMREGWDQGIIIDMMNTYFDETTFSRSRLGAEEQGWDRFGSANYDELEANLYLYCLDGQCSYGDY